MIGASGAISAIVGAYALLYGRSRARAIGPIPAAVVNIAWLAAGWAAINILVAWVAQSAGLGIAAGAHVGGFLAGLALMRPLLAWNWRSA
jgi:membrane associated rhomboid family serine protease